MSDMQNDTTQAPWEKWNLTPYRPEDEDTSPPVSLCVPPVEKTIRQIVLYTEVTSRSMCGKRMIAASKRERGKFGRRSPTKHSYPCTRRATVTVQYDDNTVAHFCKEHAPR